MPFIFRCPACDKIVEKKPKMIGNVYYIPETVIHTHKGHVHILWQLSLEDVIKMKGLNK